MVAPARGQEGLADDMANEMATQARAQQAQAPDYTYKNGNFRLLVIPALSLQWNDNINATQTGKEDDFIILPTVGVVMSYPLSERNLLQVNVTGGYDEYTMHPHLSSFYLQTGSGLSFNVSVKDILINLHDQISYVENSSQNPQVAGTGTYGTFQNDAGLSGDWSLKYFDFTLGYDHQNSESTSAEFDQINNSTESAYTRLGYKFSSKLTAGVEGTIAYTAYNQNVLNDNTAYSAGVYAIWKPGSFLQIEPRVGYTLDQFEHTSQDLQTSNLNSWYVDVNISHQITRAINYTIDAGHNISSGLQSDVNEYWYANAGLGWNFAPGLSLQPTFSYQHGNSGFGSTVLSAGMSNPFLLQQHEIYDWYVTGVSLNYAVSKRLTVSCSYQLTERTSSLADRGYTQNIVGITLTYRPI